MKLLTHCLACCLLPALWLAQIAHGQQNAATPSTTPSTANSPNEQTDSPTAAYLGLIRPVDEVRSDMSNWSTIEQAAFATAMKDAAEQCLQLQKSPFDGDELLALARICALGQNWPGTFSAARLYTRNPTPAHRADGFALLLQADLHLDSTRDILDHLTELRGNGPLSAAEDAIFNYAIQSLQISHSSYAVSAALLRQPDLLACLDTCSSDLSRPQSEAEAWRTVTLVRENGSTNVDAAANEIQAAAAARSLPLNPHDARIAQLARRQYETLGKPMPGLPSRRKCTGPAQHSNSTCTVLYVVVPEDAPTTPAAMKAVENLNTRLRPGQAANLALSSCTGSFGLHAAHTLCIKSPLLADLGADAAPLLVLVDNTGNIAWTTTGSLTWLTPKGAAEALLQRVADAQ